MGGNIIEDVRHFKKTTINTYLYSLPDKKQSDTYKADVSIRRLEVRVGFPKKPTRLYRLIASFRSASLLYRFASLRFSSRTVNGTVAGI